MLSGAITISRLAKVTYGEAAATALPAAAERAGASRVFIMASQSLVERGPEICGDQRRALVSAMRAYIPACPPTRRRDAVLAAAHGAREAGADMVATVGGGSITDGAKAVTLALEHDSEGHAGFRPLHHADGGGRHDQLAGIPEPQHPAGLLPHDTFGR